jgi:hypothetical protein
LPRSPSRRAGESKNTRDLATMRVM